MMVLCCRCGEDTSGVCRTGCEAFLFQSLAARRSIRPRRKGAARRSRPASARCEIGPRSCAQRNNGGVGGLFHRRYHLSRHRADRPCLGYQCPRSCTLPIPDSNDFWATSHREPRPPTGISYEDPYMKIHRRGRLRLNRLTVALHRRRSGCTHMAPQRRPLGAALRAEPRLAGSVSISGPLHGIHRHKVTEPSGPVLDEAGTVLHPLEPVIFRRVRRQLVDGQP